MSKTKKRSSNTNEQYVLMTVEEYTPNQLLAYFNLHGYIRFFSKVDPTEQVGLLFDNEKPHRIEYYNMKETELIPSACIGEIYDLLDKGYEPTLVKKERVFL